MMSYVHGVEGSTLSGEFSSTVYLQQGQFPQHECILYNLFRFL